MTKGRKAIPNELKNLRGTNQPCRLSDGLNIFPIANINAVIDTANLKMLQTKRAKDIFKTKANQLITLGVLTEFDLEQLSIYAYSLDRVYLCMEELKNGMYKEVYDDNGHVYRFVENPYLKLYRDMVDIVNKIGANFGFSPVDRQKLKAEKPKEVDPLQQLLDNLG